MKIITIIAMNMQKVNNLNLMRSQGWIDQRIEQGIRIVELSFSV
jgi:hypothetical protein